MLTTTLNNKITIIRDSGVIFPELYLDIFLAPENRVEERQLASLFARAKCKKARSPEEADIVVFGGGPDVNPIYYDETKHHTTRFDSKRDEADSKLYETCLNLGIPMVGICRGAQFLAVCNGAKLYQDIDEHQGFHHIWDFADKKMVTKVSSVHHQAVRHCDGMEVVADTFRSKRRAINATTSELGHHTCDRKENGTFGDIEAFFFRDTCCFGVQGHPEYTGYEDYSSWFLHKIKAYIVDNPDLYLTKDGPKYLRIKPDLLEERAALKSKELN